MSVRIHFLAIVSLCAVSCAGVPGRDGSGIELSSNESTARECAESSGYRDGIYDCIEVLFGTNRNKEFFRPQTVFGPRLIDETFLGQMTVTVPTRRLGKPGSEIDKLGTNVQVVTQEDRRRYFALWGMPDDLSLSEFSDVIGMHLQSARTYEQQALIFIHGFNVTFRNAAFRAAQLKYDLRFDGPVFFYSWPANGDARAYLSDQDDADLSADDVFDFIKHVRASLPEDTKLHVIAHSMGTRILAQVLRDLADEGDFVDQTPFDLVVFASSDLDRELFEEWVGEGLSLAKRVAIYSSKVDRALKASNWLRNAGFFSDSDDPKARIGLIQQLTGPSIVEGAYTIDISNVNTTPWGWVIPTNHSDYAESPEIIAHLTTLLREADAVMPAGAANQNRFLRRCYENKPYWIYSARGGRSDVACESE